MRGQNARFNGHANDGEVDDNFWEQAAAEQAAGRGNEGDESRSSNCCSLDSTEHRIV